MHGSDLRVIETSQDEDLEPLSRYLEGKRIRHRIFEERGRLVLTVADAEAVGPVRHAYQAWRDGVLEIGREHAAAPHPGRPRLGRLRAEVRRFPALIVLLALALVIFPFSVSVADGELTTVAGWLTVVDLTGATAEPAGLLTGQLWRWVTPILLHFSAVHLLFNLAVTFDLGRRIEFGRGSMGFAGVVVVAAVVSNLGQYLLSGNPMFGGLSGVAYALLGFVLVCRRRFPSDPVWNVHPGFAAGLVLFLVIFSTGVTEPFGLYVANQAHWLGIGTGALLGSLSPAPRRLP